MPLGFIPKYWTKSKDSRVTQCVRADMNDKQNTFILKRNERVSRSEHTINYDGPYSLYDEKDLQNLIELSRVTSINASSLNMVESKSLLRVYEGQTALSIFYNRK